MATKRKTAAEIREEEIVKAEAEMMEEDDAEETEPAGDTSSALRAPSPQGEGYDEKDAEIAALKAKLAKLQAESVTEVFVPNGRGDMERLQRVATEAEERGANTWNIMVKVRVPRKLGAGDDDFWVSVNGQSAQIPANGMVQEMKLPYAMALMDALEAEEKAIEFAEGLKLYDPVTNPKPMG